MSVVPTALIFRRALSHRFQGLLPSPNFQSKWLLDLIAVRNSDSISQFASTCIATSNDIDDGRGVESHVDRSQLGYRNGHCHGFGNSAPAVAGQDSDVLTHGNQPILNTLLI